MKASVSANVSVVVPCFCCAETIERAVSSVYAQTMRPREIILIDDNSSDETLVRLRALKAKYSGDWIKVIALKENVGPGEARNVGWDLAIGDYIAFLDADDSWCAQKIELQYLWMINHPEVDLTGHDYAVIREGESSVSKDSFPSIHELDFKSVGSLEILFFNRFPTPSVMLKREIQSRFSLGKYRGEDYLLWCEILLDGRKAYRSSLVLANIYKAAYGEGGLSGNLLLMERGSQDAYRRLYRSGRLNLLALQGLLFWSRVKFARRRILSFLTHRCHR